VNVDPVVITATDKPSSPAWVAVKTYCPGIPSVVRMVTVACGELLKRMMYACCPPLAKN